MIYDFQGDLLNLLCQQGMATPEMQLQFLCQLTGEAPQTVMLWGARLELTPPLYRGLILGYVIGFTAAQTVSPAIVQAQAEAQITVMAWQHHFDSQAAMQQHIHEASMMRW